MHISKTIEACRVHLFDIVTQYKAIFPDDDSILAGIHGNTGKQADGTLFFGWLNSKVCESGVVYPFCFLCIHFVDLLFHYHIICPFINTVLVCVCPLHQLTICPLI